MAKKLKLRPVFVLREVQVKFQDLKKGDLYRFDKAIPTDPVNPEEWNLILEHPHFTGLRTDCVKSQPIAFTPQYDVRQVKFK